MKRFLLAACVPVTLASLLASAASVSQTATPTNTSGSVLAAASAKSGKAIGRFNLPDRQTPGTMKGELEFKRGLTFLSFDTNVLRNAPAGMGGEIRGTARVRSGPLKGKKARVHGVWMPNKPGEGDFKAVVFIPADPNTGRPRKVIAQMAGSFNDPDGPTGRRGGFRGRWRR